MSVLIALPIKTGGILLQENVTILLSELIVLGMGKLLAFGDLEFDIREPHDRKYVSVYLATFFFIWGEDASYFLSSLTLCTLIRMYRLAFNPTSCVGDRIPFHLLTDFFYHVHFAAHFYTRDGSLGILTG